MSIYIQGEVLAMFISDDAHSDATALIAQPALSDSGVRKPAIAVSDEHDDRGGLTPTLTGSLHHITSCNVSSKTATAAALGERDGRDGVRRFETSHVAIVAHRHMPSNRHAAGAGGNRTRGMTGLKSGTSTPSNRPSCLPITRGYSNGKSGR
jgi:hypothetical protein